MRLSREDAYTRLAGQVHGVLCTVHPERGPDPLPVVYAVDDDHLAVASLIDALADRLSRTVPQYADKPFHRVIVCRIVAVSGWTASEAIAGKRHSALSGPADR